MNWPDLRDTFLIGFWGGVYFVAIGAEYLLKKKGWR